MNCVQPHSEGGVCLQVLLQVVAWMKSVIVSAVMRRNPLPPQSIQDLISFLMQSFSFRSQEERYAA